MLCSEFIGPPAHVIWRGTNQPTPRDGYAPQNMQTTDFPGFGDEAYTNTISVSNLGITTNTLVARKGKVELLVSSSASFEQEKSLEQKLFDALA